ncbi:MAG: ABC-2 family transporter protein [Ruminiclostridium sp.]|nr:ABC-2 family transporter protein [Ruminiclostridium sp.]
MFRKIYRYFDILKAVASATYKEWAAYRTHSMVSIFVGPVYFLVQFFIWKAVYESRGSINGFTLEQTLTYFGISALIEYLIMDFADWNLQMLIHTGKFLTFMLKPMSHVYFAFSQKIGHRILGFIFEFTPVMLIFLLVFRITIFPVRPFWALISIILGYLMRFLVDYSIGITAFWFTKTSGIRRVFLLFRDVCSGVFFPLAFLPELWQKALMLLPFQFIAYVPIRVFIGSYELGGISCSIPQIVAIQAAAVTVMAIFTIVLYKIGVRRFTGVGT